LKASVLFAFVLAGFIALDQQPRDDSYEGIVKDMLVTVDQITKTLLTIKDRDTAEAVRPELKKTAQRMLELRKKADEKQPNKEEKDRLQKEYAPKFEKAVKQLRDVTAKIKSIPGGEDALEELQILKDKVENEAPKSKKESK
jgi:hypothetical protein